MAGKKQGTVYRGVKYRLIPGTLGNAIFLFAMCGACRKVWNLFPGRNQEQCVSVKKNGTPPSSWRTLFKEFTLLRKEKEYTWLQEYSSMCVRYTPKQFSKSRTNYFVGQAQKSRFHAKHSTRPCFTIPDSVKIKEGQIDISKRGYMPIRRRGGNPYLSGKPKRATICERSDRRYVTVCYEMNAPVCTDNWFVAGINRNAPGMIAVAYSDDTPDKVIHRPAKRIYEIRERRHQRRPHMSNRARKTLYRVNKWKRKRSNCRHSRTHQNSVQVGKNASTVIMEKLYIAGMIKSGKGNMENPGTNVKAKSGLNRALLESVSSQLAQMLDYKCLEVIYVLAAYTSQTCYKYGYRDPANRGSLRTFMCVSCIHADHANLNAVANILASGTGASGCAWGDPSGTPMTRQVTDRRTSV